MSNKEKYNSIFMSVFSVDESALNEEFTFAAVEAWDSLTHLTLVSELEDGFDVILDTEDILHFGGYCNGMNILEKNGVSFEE